MKPNDFVAVPGTPIRLSDLDPALTHGFKNKQSANVKLERDRERLTALQDVFFAARRFALLIIFQGMDGAGKDGAIKHVMSGVNPQGVDVSQFKRPTPEELDHDFLWRCAIKLPARGRFGIFNRSYYEEVLVVRVHPESLRAEAASTRSGDSIWDERFEDINAFERHLVRNGTRILKFFLHISKDEQRRRFLKRLEDSNKNWKVSPADMAERKYWEDYQRAYEDAINHTSTTWAPWHIIPSDHKWFARVAIGDVLVARLEELRLKYPKFGTEQRADFKRIKAKLLREGGG